MSRASDIQQQQEIEMLKETVDVLILMQDSLIDVLRSTDLHGSELSVLEDQSRELYRQRYPQR